MATEASMAATEQDANVRIKKALARISEHFNIEIPAQPFERGNSRYLQVKALEHQANVLDVIVTAACGDGPNLAKMKRDELNAYALKHGVADPESYRSKDELIEAIDAGVYTLADGQGTTAEVTQDGTPVVVTEANAD